MSDHDDMKAAVARLEESDLIATVERNHKKWETWFPNPESYVDVPRADVDALIAIAKAYLARLEADEKRAVEGDEPVTWGWIETQPGWEPCGNWRFIHKWGAGRFEWTDRGLFYSVNGATLTVELGITKNKLRRLIAALEG